MSQTMTQAVTIAGIDSSGGAGINADTRVMQRLGVYPATIVVGLTAQNTTGVQAIETTTPHFLREQFASVKADLNITAAKTGALFDAEHVAIVAEEVADWQLPHFVVDPVMIAKGGAQLLSDDAIQLVREALIPLATVITPNLEEAEVLVGYAINDDQTTQQAARDLQKMGADNVVLKGGHRRVTDNQACDFVQLASGETFWLEAPFIATKNTHGTGDTFAAFITARLAQGEDLKPTLYAAKAFVHATIAQGITVGHGHGPLNHWADWSM